MTRVFTTIAISSVALTLAGCAARGGTSFSNGDDDAVALSRSGLTVEVQNQNYYPATIYAYRSGSRRRLGHVEAHDVTSFSFAWTSTDLRFLIDFLAAGCILTESMGVDQGDDLLLILEPDDNRKASRAVCAT